MKRSEINKALKELEAMCQKHCCYLPPFCHFTPEQWQEMGHEYDEVRDCMLGWDITDYGMGDFSKYGFSLITIRNGNRAMEEKYPKVYAEKLLYLKEGQYAPNHFHWFKTEDIINRGGGNVLIRLMISSVLNQWKWLGAYCPSFRYSSFSAYTLGYFSSMARLPLRMVIREKPNLSKLPRP